MIRLHSEGFHFTAGPVTLTVICRARRTRWSIQDEQQTVTRRPAALLHLRLSPEHTGQPWTVAPYHYGLSIIGGARAP